MTKLSSAPGAYVITHNPSGRFYIGSSGNVRARINQHYHLLRHDKHPSGRLQEVFTNTDDITIDVTPAPDKDGAFESEQAILDARFSDPLCCNNAPGARTLWKDGMPEEQRRLRSDKMKGHSVSDHVRESVRKANTGLKRSPETLQRMREAKAEQAAKQSIPVIVNGVEYKSNKEAIEKLGINKRTLTKRLNSDDPKWADWKTK